MRNYDTRTEAISFSQEAYTNAHNRMVELIEDGANPLRDSIVADQLVGSLGLVSQIVGTEYSHRTSPVIDGDDLEIIGFLKLIDALRGFNPLYGKFSTLAGLAVRRELSRQVRRFRSSLSVPIDVGRTATSYLATHEFGNITGLEVVATESIDRQIARQRYEAEKRKKQKSFNPNRQKRIAALTDGLTHAVSSYRTIPLAPDATLHYGPTESPPEGTYLSDLEQIPDIDRHATVVDDAQDQLITRALEVESAVATIRTKVAPLIEILPARERDMYQSVFPLNGRQPETLEVVGKRYGITRERVRQICVRIHGLMQLAIERDAGEGRALILSAYRKQYNQDELLALSPPQSGITSEARA